MKSFVLTFILSATMLLTACQSFQFVESPIPIKPLPAKIINK